MSETSLRALAQNVLARKRDSAWDSSGTAAGQVSQARKTSWDSKDEPNQRINPTVPLSQPLGVGQWDKTQKRGTALGTVAGQSQNGARRCNHCGGAIGALNPWNWPGRPNGIWLHPRCEYQWYDAETGRGRRN
jgi:hypothetical protein